MPWQVPITVDGLEYPVTFNTEGEPTQQDYDEAVQQILSQKAQAAPEPEPETPGYLSQLGSALGLGYRQMKSGVGATFNALTGDTADVAAEMAEMSKLQREQQATQTPEDVEFIRSLEEAEKGFEQAQGPLESIGALAQYPAAVFAQPGAAFKTAVQSAPNALISGATSLAGYGLGGLVGGVAGIETGPGAILTGLAGATAGGALSNTLMEAGPSIFDVLNERTQGAASNMTADEIAAYLQQNPDIVDEGLKTGAIRGSVIGAVEALGVKGSGRLLTMPERAAARAVQKELMAQGVDVASKEAVDKALLDPALRASTKAVAETAKNQFSSAGNMARLAGASAIETGAAGAGELAAQAAAGQDISTKEAFLEMMGDAALSLPMAATTKAFEGAKYMLNPALVSDLGKASAENLAATGSTAAAKAQEGFNEAIEITMLPFTREDIRATEMPFTREDIRATDLPFTREDIRATQLPFGREDIRAMEMPFSREDIRGISTPAQVAEEAGAEVTPLSEGAERVVTPEEESLAAKRRADLLSAAADVAKGKTKAQVSPAVTAMVTPQPVETQEDATREIPLEESVREEPQDRIESREAEETGAGDQLRSPATGEEEVATFGLNPLTKPKIPPRKGFYGEVKGASGQTLGSLWKDKDGNFRVYQLEDFSNRIIAESPPIPKERIKKAGGVQVSAGQSVQFYRILPSSDLVDGDRQSESQNQPPQKPVTEPETAGQSSAQAVKAGVSEEKTQTQKIYDQGASIGNTRVSREPAKENRTLVQGDGRTPTSKKMGVSSEGSGSAFIISNAPVVSFREYSDAPAESPRGLSERRRTVTESKIESAKKTASSFESDVYIVMDRETPTRASGEPRVSRIKDGFVMAIVSPDGSVFLQDGAFRPNPQTKQAAEKQTPVPLREGTGAAGVVQSEPVEGSIPTVEKVSTETESESSGNLPAVEQIDRLVQAGAKPEEMDKFVKSLTDEQFNELVASEAFDVDPKLAIKPNDTYDAKRIKRRKFVDAVNASTKEARKTAQQVFQEEEAAAKKQQAGEEMRSKAIDSIIGASEKKKRKFGQVTNSDAIAAVAMLVSSKDVPGVLTTWTGTKDEFLRDPANQTADPEIYARIKAGELVEGFFNKGRAYVFLDGIGVSDEDMLRGEQMSVTPQVAAVRRVLLHESLVHRGIHGLPLRHRRLILNWVRQNSTPAELDELAKLYTEYANWRNSDYEFEALAEELLAKKVDSLTEIPKDGPMAKLMDILRQIWDFIVGYKREPTLSDLKSVVKLLKSGAEALANDRLKDGGEVKLSIRAYHGTPHKVDKFTTAKIGTGEGAQAYGWGLYYAEAQPVAKKYAKALSQSANTILVNGEAFTFVSDGMAKDVASYDSPIEWANAAKARLQDDLNDKIRLSQQRKDEMQWLISKIEDGLAIDPEGNGNLYTVELLPDESEFLDWDKPLAEQSEKVKAAVGEMWQNWINQSPLTLENGASQEQVDAIQNSRGSDFYALLAEDDSAESDQGNIQAASKRLASLGIPGIRYLDGGSRGAGDGTHNYVIFDENLVRILEENGQSLTPPEGSDIRFSRPQFSSDTSAALSAGSEAARSTLYSERDMDIREAIRRAYEAMPKTNSVAVPIGELFAKTEELMPGVTQEEFSLVLQDLFEDNGAVLQEGEVVEPLTEQDRRYLELAEDEDANREELQRMVDEEAKATGLNVSGVGNGITYEAGDEPDSVYGERDNVMSHGGTFGFYFSDNPAVWSDYAKPRRKGEKGRVNRTFLSLKTPFRFSKEFVSYDELQTLLRDGGVALPAEVKSRLDRLVAGGFGDTQPVWKWLHPTHVGAGASYGESLKKAFTNAGYDGVIHPDSSLMDGGLDTPATSYVVFNPSQIKSADPVTRDDQGRIIPLSRRFDTGADIRGQINVTTPEGRRAGFVVVMPRAAKSSRIKAEDVADAAKTFQSDIIEAGKGRIDTASYQGNTLKSTDAPDHNVNAPELYKDAAISLVDSLLKKHSITDIANSFQDPDLRVAFGLLGNKAINPNVAQQAELFTGAVISKKLEEAVNKESDPAKKRLIEKTLKRHKAYYNTSTGMGQNLNAVRVLQQDPDFKEMFLFNKAQDEMADKAKDKLDTITGGGTQPVTDMVNQSEEAAADEATNEMTSDAEDDQDAIDLAAGEETLTGKLKELYEELKDLIREEGVIAGLMKKAGSMAKASLSAERRNELASMTVEQLKKRSEKNKKRIGEILEALLGKESDAKTPEQKKTRAKRKKMVDTAKKRAEAGKEIEVTRIQIQSFMDELMPGYTERKSIVNEVGDALLKAAEQRKAKPRQRTAIQDFVSAIKQTLMANIRGDKISAEQPSLGMLLAKTFAQQGSEAEAFAAAWANGRKKVRGMLAEMGVEEGNLDAELDAIMPPTPTLAYAPAAARKAISSAMREAGLMRSDLLNDPAASKKAIMEKFDEAAKSANLTEEGWDKKGRALAEKAVDESIAEAKMAQERAKKVAKIISEQAEKPVSLEDFGAKLAEFRFKKDKIAELFNRAKKLAERKIQMANDQAIRVLLAAENKLAQSAFFNASEKPDTIVKAFREQVEEPMERDAFKKRMEKMLVTPEMADKLFDRAARERDNARWKKAQDLLEGPNALQNLLRQMNMARPGEQAPFSKQISWREILSQKAKTVEEYRQRIFDAISANEAFQNLSDEQKGRLSDLFSEAWESKRTDILDRMLEREIDRKRREGSLSEAAAKALQKSRNKIIELANLGGFDNDDLMKVLGEKFGIKTGFSEAEKARISELADKLQDETLNPAKRNKLAMEFAVTLAGASEIPVAEIIANWWTSSVLFGPQTIFSIGAAFVNGAYNITTIGTRRMLADLTRGDVKGAIEESILMLQGIAKYLGAFKQAGRRAWSYLWTGNVDVLGAAANDILGEINSLEELKRFKRHKLLAENLAKDPRALRRYVGMYLRFVNRLLTSLDAFNVMVTKAGTASLALRMSGMSTDNIIKAEKMLNLKAYKDQVIRDYFDNKAPTTQAEKALVDSYAEAEMYRAVDQLGGKMENADYLASESAMTMNPTGLGGFFYRSITGLDSKMKKAAEDYLEKAKKDWTTEKDLESTLFLGLAYLRQFAVQNLGGVAGYKFIRFASNKFNQGISYLPMVGLLRTLEAKGDDIKGKEAFIETIHRNQVIGAVLTLAAIAVVKALEDEPDDEKRGNFWNGGWQNLTPDQKKQMLAKGQKEYTMGFKFNGRWYVFNYQNWPLNQVLAAIGSMSDQIRFSPKQWEEKGPLSKSLAGIVSGLKSTLEIPALSQLGTLVGNRLASKDPTEQTVDRLSNVAAGWVGGFVPRILKDLDFATQPELRKYKTLWEKTASHIPIYRRYVGEDYYDILGQPIKRNVIPGSREFMMGPTEPEYKILGALNSRNIFLTPANAEYRMVGKGRNRRRLTQEEADAYSLETGKGYRQMLLRYGQRALQMPTERARAFLSDKADEVRDRALKKVYRR